MGRADAGAGFALACMLSSCLMNHERPSFDRLEPLELSRIQVAAHALCLTGYLVPHVVDRLFRPPKNNDASRERVAQCV